MLKIPRKTRGSPVTNASQKVPTFNEVLIEEMKKGDSISETVLRARLRLQQLKLEARASK
jgi:hypothetical protein